MGDHSDDEALFAALENEDDDSYRTQRIQQLNAELAAQKNNRSANPSDTATLVARDSIYPTLTNDQGVLNFTTETTRCIVHFAHDDFARCAMMDSQLKELAGRHYDVKFARVDVRNTPFLAEKLSIRVLPCVIGFKDGVGVERVVGFEGLGAGGTDGSDAGFSIKVLEKRLLFKGVLMQARFSAEDEDEDEGHDSDDDGQDVRKGMKLRKKAIRSGNTARRGRYDDDDDWE